SLQRKLRRNPQKRRVSTLITKYLVQGKQLFFASQPPDAQLGLGKGMELKMPLEIFWESEKLLKRIDYLLASGEPNTEVQIEIKRLYKLLSPFCVVEADRTWMIERSRGG